MTLVPCWFHSLELNMQSRLWLNQIDKVNEMNFCCSLSQSNNLTSTSRSWKQQLTPTVNLHRSSLRLSLASLLTPQPHAALQGWPAYLSACPHASILSSPAVNDWPSLWHSCCPPPRFSFHSHFLPDEVSLSLEFDTAPQRFPCIYLFLSAFAFPEHSNFHIK